jgi:hypothetical protein
MWYGYLQRNVTMAENEMALSINQRRNEVMKAKLWRISWQHHAGSGSVMKKKMIMKAEENQ